MDIQENLKRKAEDLIRKAELLPSIHIKWEEPFLVQCKELKSIEYLQEKKVLDLFANHKKQPAIYFFEIKSDQTNDLIVNTLKSFKAKKERSCPKIHKNLNHDSKYLYCGSKKEGLHGRFIQHLGFGSQNTFALQLNHWAKEMSLELEFHYAWLDKTQKDYTELVESALASKIKPLVGK